MEHNWSLTQFPKSLHLTLLAGLFLVLLYNCTSDYAPVLQDVMEESVKKTYLHARSQHLSGQGYQH